MSSQGDQLIQCAQLEGVMDAVRWHRVGCVFVLLAVLALAACGRAGPPPVPTQNRHPDFIGRITAWASEEGGRTRLSLRSDAGELLDVSLRLVPTAADDGWLTTRLTPASVETDLLEDGGVRDGALVLYGEDDEGIFYGVARPSRSCFEISFGVQEGAYLEGGDVHLVTGLVLESALDAPRRPNDWPLRSGDSVCLDALGTVIDYEVFLPY
jgi:hypothetical protein